jgi:hypothetical protein
LAALVTSTISARRMPLLSLALNVIGSPPLRTPGSSSPVVDFTPSSMGGRTSSTVTLEPMR